MDKLKKFIEDNHNLVEEYHKCYYERYGVKDWREQIRILFVNALSAGGEGKISEKSNTIQKFEEILQKMKSPTYTELLTAFDCENYQKLFEKINLFEQMGAKKSALFLRDILFFQNIINEVPKDLMTRYLVPVDRVIVRTINSIFNKTFIPNQIKTFNEINQLAKEIFPNRPIFLEDLWFWGRFYRCKENKKSSIPFCKFNKDLLIIDINVTKEYRNKLIQFSDKQNNCPFQDICSRW